MLNMGLCYATELHSAGVHDIVDISNDISVSERICRPGAAHRR